uniref:ankyrin repeat and SAM domain-containing protein 6 n=1 Tax=Myxine glutinosa TaxID=7769 RepID=UPI00358F0A9E
METHDAAALHLLLRACEEGDPGRVRQILDAEDTRMGADSSDHEGNGPLHVAAAAGQEATLRALVARGATLEARSDLGWTPLMEAVRRGRLSCLSALLEHGASATATNRYGVTALALAAGEGSVGVVRALLERGAGNSGISGMDRETGTFGVLGTRPGSGAFSPLVMAAGRGHDEVVRILLEWGFEVNEREELTGWTPLMAACLYGHSDLAQNLVAHGAETNITNTARKTALDIAQSLGHRGLSRYLQDKTAALPGDANSTQVNIFHVIQVGNASEVDKVLAEDPRLANVSDADGATPLTIAAIAGNVGVAHVLLDRGARPNHRDPVNGWTALMQAAFHGQTAVVRLLVARGATVGLRTSTGLAAFELSTLSGDSDPELVRFLGSVTMTGVEKRRCTGSLEVHERPWCDVLPDGGGTLRSWWTRMSNRFRNLKPSRTLRRGLPAGHLAPPMFTGEDGEHEKTHGSLETQSTSSAMLRVKSEEPENKEARATMAWRAGTQFDGLGGGAGPIDPMISNMMLSGQPTSSSTWLHPQPVVPPFLPPRRLQLPRRGSLGRTANLLDPPEMECQVRRGQRSENSGGSDIISVSRVSSDGRGKPSASFRSTRMIPHTAMGSMPHRDPSMFSGNSILSQMAAHRRRGAPEGGRSSPSDCGESRSGTQLTVRASAHRSPCFTSSEKNKPSQDDMQRKAAGRSHSTSPTLTPAAPSRCTSSTLTPPPSPTPKGFIAASRSSGASQGELSTLLQQLSLQTYRPIFEEHEVDLEAFLTLSDLDLQELGVSSSGSRLQLLGAISRLNSSLWICFA